MKLRDPLYFQAICYYVVVGRVVGEHIMEIFNGETMRLLLVHREGDQN